MNLPDALRLLAYFNLIQLFAKRKLFHQKRRVAYGCCSLARSKPWAKADILHAPVDGSVCRAWLMVADCDRSQLFSLSTAGEFVRMILTLQVLKTDRQRPEINRVLSG